jgi:hypothetical protein
MRIMGNVSRFPTKQQVPSWRQQIEVESHGHVLTDDERAAQIEAWRAEEKAKYLRRFAETERRLQIEREEDEAERAALRQRHALSQFRAKPRRRAHLAHLPAKRAFETAAVWQYRSDSDGRKWFVACARRQWLAQFLAGYPSVYMGTDYLTRQLQKSPGTFRKPDGGVLRLTWSLRTVKRTLAALRRLGVESPCGRIGYRRPRLRKLHPEALRSEPFAVPPKPNRPESGTVTFRESGTRESPKSESEKPLKNQNRYGVDSPPANTAGGRAIECPVTVKTAEPTPAEPPRELGPNNENIIRILMALTHRYGLEYASSLLGWIHERINRRKRYGQRRIRHVAYYVRAADAFFEQHEQTDWLIEEERYDIASQAGFTWNDSRSRWVHESEECAA